MWTPDYYVRLTPLPDTVDGVVTPNDDGSFDIYLNSRSPEEKRKRWLAHELEHIRRDHFYRDAPVAILEEEAGEEPRREKGRTPERGGIMLFSSPEAVTRYYMEDPDRLREDYEK